MSSHLVNTTTIAELTDINRKSYENGEKDIYEFPVPHGRCGPFFHVDSEKFVVKQTNGLLGLNKDHVMYVRCDAIRGYFSNKNLLTDSLKQLLKKRKEEIEMDREFKLREEIISCVPLASDHDKGELLEIYKMTSRGRWAGLTEPNDFEEADKLYCFRQFIRERTRSHLFKFYLDVHESSGPKPVGFFGKVAGGSSFQIKFNNAAMGFIVGIEEIRNTGWPYKHPK